MTWTRFMDMHSGGGTKEGSYEKILIQAPQAEAEKIFYNKFGHNPSRVSCTCCGEDYSISEDEDLTQITAYDRNCAHVYFYEDDDTEATDERFGGSEVKYDHELKAWTHKGRKVNSRYVERPNLSSMRYGASKKECEERYRTLAEYLKSPEVLVVEEDDIADAEREGSLPEQGFVWHD